MLTTLALSLSLLAPAAVAWPGFLGAEATPISVDSLQLTWSALPPSPAAS